MNKIEHPFGSEEMHEANKKFFSKWEVKIPKTPEELKTVNLENYIEIKKGMVYETSDEKLEWQRTINDSPDEKSIGLYSINNRIITFVDGQRRKFASPATPELVQELEGAGYIEGSLYVPFSNGEMPASPADNEKWQSLLEVRQESENEVD